MRRQFSRGVLTIVAIVLVLAVAVTAGILALFRKAEPFVVEAHCSVTTPEGKLDLEIEQAQIAAVIAAVAARRKLPERAVVIAYATAIQESKLYNLSYGDRDSVGVFQQRESQGWGDKKDLMNPVYSANKFFAALVKVKRYLKLPLAEAAQEVQRSAGGYAYAPHEPDAKILAAAFTGRVPKALRCVYPPAKDSTAGAAPRTGEAQKELVKALGRTATSGARISAASTRRGWLIASWSVAHAERFDLRGVGFDGTTWSAGAGEDWKPGGKATGRQVELS